MIHPLRRCRRCWLTHAEHDWDGKKYYCPENPDESFLDGPDEEDE